MPQTTIITEPATSEACATPAGPNGTVSLVLTVMTTATATIELPEGRT